VSRLIEFDNDKNVVKFARPAAAEARSEYLASIGAID